MNEGSTSRFYSFNIYLKSDIIYYHRNYKKRVNLIFSEGLPIVNVVFIIFRFIAKVFKISSENKKITELLFENLKEKKSLMKINEKNLNNVTQKLSLFKNNSQMINRKNTINNNNNDFSSVQLNPYKSGKQIIFENNNNSIVNSNKIKFIKDENNIIFNKLYSKNKKEKLYNNSLVLNEKKIMNKNINNNNIDVHKKKIKDTPNLSFNNINNKNDDISQNNENFGNNININNKNQYIKKKLFPYRYYLCSIFIKDSKKSLCFTKQFIVVYNFICQLFDISSYLILQREFQTMKNTIIGEKQRNIIEKGHKINISSESFNINLRECWEINKFSISGGINQTKDIDS